MKVKVYNIKGEEKEEIELDDSVFGLKRNDDLVNQVFLSLAGNARQVLAHTKTKGERSGSGAKPWKQKGTGRARVGTKRNPLWRKGGVAFGPRSDRNFTTKVNKKMNAKAITLVLSGKLQDQEIFIVDKLDIKEKKTKEVSEILKNLKITNKTLMAFGKEEKELRIASRNLKKVENILVEQINVLDMMNNKNLLLSKESVRYLETKYKK